MEDRAHVGKLAKSFSDSIGTEIQSALHNWKGHRLSGSDDDSESLSADRLMNILSLGISLLRQLAASALVGLKCPGRFHSGEAGVFRIIRGPEVKLDDFPRQQLPIGPLLFQAVDYGDSLRLVESAQLFIATETCGRWSRGPQSVRPYFAVGGDLGAGRSYQ